jgi:hypothetical protein
MSLLSSIFKKSDGATITLCNVSHACYDECKWKCDFDKSTDVFCHLVGTDLTHDQVEILKHVGCHSWKWKETKNNL